MLRSEGRFCSTINRRPVRGRSMRDLLGFTVIVAVRLHDLVGRPLGYCGRRLDPKEIALWGKWRFPKNFPKSDCLFSAHRAYPFRQGGLVVVECPWAAMRLSQAGIPGTVALLGTHMSEVQAAWLAKARSILLLLDGDAAGHEATDRLKATLSRRTRVRTYRLPDGLEPEDLVDDELRRIVIQVFSSIAGSPQG